MQKELTVFAEEVVSGNGVRHLRMEFEGVTYTAEGDNLDDADLLTATKGIDDGAPDCVREAKGLRVFDSLP